ncbi:hypothetical protein JMJ35_002016 [Cladonia borealis]|uniref:Origin recognition complex subunit n=1 Tax=Cladonia borealis TaxID=184061 RepID=A0AA39V4R1_9LECA|nr:hypothetical protein JMJ35_002016 [Cladonia borealis]
MTEYEPCYVFTPDEAVEQGHRPSKRRKTARLNNLDAQHEVPPLVPLLRGTELPATVKFRYETFNTLCSSKESSVNESIIDAANVSTAEEVSSFISSSDSASSAVKIRTGLVVSGPNNGSSAKLFESIMQRVHVRHRAILVALSSGQSPNLKTVLKYINQHARTQTLESDEDTVIDGAEDTRQLNYDLQILHDHIQAHTIDRVVIAFEDSEAFEAKLLGDLIDILSAWNGRIPFVILFNIATSIEIFQAKLSRDTIRRLDGAEFRAEGLDVEEVFQTVNDYRSTLWLGPSLSDQMLQQQRDYIQSPLALEEAVKYAYMTHFFANPLGILLAEDHTQVPLQKEHFEAVRNLPSFRRYAQSLISARDYETVRDLLVDDENLNDLLMQGLGISRDAISQLIGAVNALNRIQSLPDCKTKVMWSHLYIRAMSGDLLNSSILEDSLSSMKKLPSDAMHELLNDLLEFAPEHELRSLLKDLNKLTNSLADPKISLRSQYDVHHETMRTTVVAQKVSLSKSTSNLSAQDAAYTKIVDRVFEYLQSYFENTLINPQDLFLNEILIYDSKSPHRDVFSPRPRHAIERALSSPHDYLGCECCGGAEEGLSSTQPATAILYKLYLESGSVINTADLWSAFWTIVGEEDSEDEDAERERVLALFSRALAELKYMGMVKNSRRKADHLAKLSWKGL